MGRRRDAAVAVAKARNLDKAKAKIARLHGAEMVEAIGKALFVAGNRIQVRAQHSITEGAVSGRFHVPSLPGQPPKADTHTLDRQIETEQVEPLKVEVSSNAPYAAHLEFGTSKMAARPYMLPAAELERQKAVELVRDAVNRVIKRAP